MDWRGWTTNPVESGLEVETLGLDFPETFARKFS